MSFTTNFVILDSICSHIRTNKTTQKGFYIVNNPQTVAILAPSPHQKQRETGKKVIDVQLYLKMATSINKAVQSFEYIYINFFQHLVPNKLVLFHTYFCIQ